MNRFCITAAIGSMVMIGSASTFATLTAILEQNTRTAEWVGVARITIAQKSSRRIRLSGPWMDYVTSINGSGGISGRNVEHADGKTTLILDASETAGRGDKEISAAITCPFGGSLIGCKDIVAIPVRVFETGPITSISPSGTVTPASTVTFTLTGDRMDVAKLMPRLLTLRNASLVHVNTSTVRVTGTTPSCGFVDVALSDQLDGDEFPYRKGNALQSVLAGTICGTSIVPPPPTFHQCPAGQNWNSATNSCQ